LLLQELLLHQTDLTVLLAAALFRGLYRLVLLPQPLLLLPRVLLLPTLLLPQRQQRALAPEEVRVLLRCCGFCLSCGLCLAAGTGPAGI
jgi:hypothetical protein